MSVTAKASEEQILVERFGRGDDSAEELGLLSRGRRLSSLNEDLSETAIEMIEAKAALGILNRQLETVQQELARAMAAHPRAGQTQMAQQNLRAAESKVIEVNRQINKLHKPVVTVIGVS